MMDRQALRNWFQAHKSELYAAVSSLDAQAVAQILTAREHTAFDRQWLAAYRDNEARKAGLSAVERSTLAGDAEYVARDMFLFTMRATQSSELAACVADDFHLIVENMMAEHANPFSDSLLTAYLQGKVPGGDM